MTGSRTAIEIDFNEFFEACNHAPKGKRIKGAKSFVPSDILLTADREGIFVETYSLSTLVLSKRPWTFRVSVDAVKLINLLNVMIKMGAKGSQITLDVEGDQLVAFLNKTKYLLKLN
jgi:hypothetical protein